MQPARRALLDRVVAALRESARVARPYCEDRRAHLVPAPAFERAMRMALDGCVDAAARAVLARFSDTPEAHLSPAGLRRVRPLVRARIDGVAALTHRSEHGQRHAALYLLGHSGDARAVRPILEAYVHVQDGYDRDYIDAAWLRLGRVATAALERIAREDPYPERREAALACLCACVESFGALRRIGATRVEREDDVEVLEGVRDPRALVALTPAILSEDPGLRSKALAAAERLTAHGPTRRLTPAERRAFCDALASAAGDRTQGTAGPALALLGRMRDRRHTARLFDAARDVVDDIAHGAIRGLGALGTPAARRALVALLDDAAPDRAQRAALALAATSPVEPRVRPRVRALLAHAATERDYYVASDARRVLFATRAGTRALASVANGPDADRAARALGAFVEHTRGAAESGRADRVVPFAAALLRPAVRRAYLRECLRLACPVRHGGLG